MIKKISKANPFNSICKDLFSVGLFDKAINGLLSIVEKNGEHRTIVIERKFVDNSGNYLVAGYYFIQCLYSVCDENDLKQFRGYLENLVKEKAKGNYMEVDPILIAPGYNDSVLNFINQYNKIQRRKPIQLFLYGE